MKLSENKQDEIRILEIFYHAFSTSLGVTWMTGGDKRKTTALLKVFIEEARLKKGTYLTKNHNGAVLFFQLQDSTTSFKLLLKKLYLVLFVIGITKGIKAIRYKKLIDKIRPNDGWLGWLVASDQQIPGNEAAFEIKREMFRMADETQQPIFVETTIPRVRALYKLAGYKEYNSIQHPFEDLTIWFFKREPNKN